MKKVSVVTSILCVALSSLHAGEGPRLDVKAARHNIVTHEPVTLQVEYGLGDSKPHETQFELEIDSKRIADRNILFPTKFYDHQVKEGGVLVFSVELFYDPLAKKYVFDVPGDYKVILREVKAAVESPPLAIHVATPEGRNKEALKLFSGNEDRVATLLTDREHGQAGKDFEELCKDYPDTVYAAYASCALGLKKFEAIKRNIEKRNKREEYRAVAGYFEKAIGKCPGSLLEERALFHLAWCQALSGDYKESNANLRLLNQKYPQGNYRVKADKMLKEMADHGV